VCNRFIDVDTGLQVGTHSSIEVCTVGQKALIPNQTQKYYIISKSQTLAAKILANNQQHIVDVLTPTIMKELQRKNKRSRVVYGNLRKSAQTIESVSPLMTAQEMNLQLNESISHHAYEYKPGDVVVCKGATHPARYATHAVLRANEFNWLSTNTQAASSDQLSYSQLPLPLPLLKRIQQHYSALHTTEQVEDATEFEFRCQCRARYRQDAPVDCVLTMRYVGANGTAIGRPTAQLTTAILKDWEILVTFPNPEIDVCPGQILVLYDGDICYGGGPIQHTVIQGFGDI
jgi:hypothetical protein